MAIAGISPTPCPMARDCDGLAVRASSGWRFFFFFFFHLQAAFAKGVHRSGPCGHINAGRGPKGEVELNQDHWGRFPVWHGFEIDSRFSLYASLKLEIRLHAEVFFFLLIFRPRGNQVVSRSCTRYEMRELLRDTKLGVCVLFFLLKPHRGFGLPFGFGQGLADDRVGSLARQASLETWRVFARAANSAHRRTQYG